MGKSKGYTSMMRVIFSVAVIIALQIIAACFLSKPLDYIINGYRGDAVVTVTGIEDDADYVEAMYMASDGRTHFSEVLTYGDVYGGEPFSAYILDREPELIFRMPKTSYIVLFIGGYALLMIIFIAILASNASAPRKNRLLSEYGIPVKGEIINVKRRKAFVHDCVVTFPDENGSYRTATVRFTRTVPAHGQECSLVYYVTARGSVLCDVIEL